MLLFSWSLPSPSLALDGPPCSLMLCCTGISCFVYTSKALSYGPPSRRSVRTRKIICACLKLTRFPLRCCTPIPTARSSIRTFAMLASSSRAAPRRYSTPLPPALPCLVPMATWTPLPTPVHFTVVSCVSMLQSFHVSATLRSKV